MIVYKVTNQVNGKIYIGKTVNTLAQRKGKHLYEAFKRNKEYALYRALRKYGKENFEWEVIDTAKTEIELREREIHWISYYKSFGINGYNLTYGGEGATGYKMSEDSKAKRKKAGFLKGSQIGTSKLTEQDVLKIKHLIKEWVSYDVIALMFNVSCTTINAIKLGYSWKHVGEDLYDFNVRTKLRDEEVLEIKRLIKEGKMSQYEISKVFNVAQAVISTIKLGKRYKEIGEDVSDCKSNKRKPVKLSAEDVREIKLLLREKKMTHKEISMKYNVAKSLISCINTEQIWKHVVV